MAVQPAFDEHHPPSPELLADCVHCGFCLPTCPTYELWGEEMDSPRGRLHLIGQGLAGGPLSDSSVEHWDRCLGCMACVTACPSGVRYDQLIEATRAQVERRHRRPAADRWRREAIFALFPYPRRLRAVRGPLRAYQRLGLGTLLERSGLLRRLPATLRAMEALAPTLGPEIPLAATTPAVGERRATVGLLTGCVQGAFFPEVNAATVRVLAAEGCEVVVPAAQSCCGALSAHAGREEEAVRFTKRVIGTFEEADVDAVVVNAAGCGSNLKDYGRLLRDEPGWADRADTLAAKTRDVSEWLAEIGQRAPRHPLPMSIAYHDACHLSHAQGVRAQPRRLLRGIPGLEMREIAHPDICCGSAGIYNVLQPEAAGQLGERKARDVLATGADMLVTANPGCWMQVATAAADLGRPVGVAHTVQVLDASLRGVDAAAVLDAARVGPGTPRRRGPGVVAPSGASSGPSDQLEPTRKV